MMLGQVCRYYCEANVSSQPKPLCLDGFLHLFFDVVGHGSSWRYEGPAESQQDVAAGGMIIRAGAGNWD